MVGDDLERVPLEIRFHLPCAPHDCQVFLLGYGVIPLGLVQRFASICYYPFSLEDYIPGSVDVFHLIAKSGRGAPLVLRFSSTVERNHWIWLKRTKRPFLCASVIDSSWRKSTVYLNERLTAYNQDLLRTVRSRIKI